MLVLAGLGDLKSMVVMLRSKVILELECFWSHPSLRDNHSQKMMVLVRSNVGLGLDRVLGLGMERVLEPSLLT